MSGNHVCLACGHEYSGESCPDHRVVIAAGDFGSGIALTGPFEDADAAGDYAEFHLRHETWVLLTLEAPIPEALHDPKALPDGWRVGEPLSECASWRCIDPFGEVAAGAPNEAAAYARCRILQRRRDFS